MRELITHPEIEHYCMLHSSAESAVLKLLREYTETNVQGAQMLSDILVGRLLQFLVKTMQAKRVLDIGTFTGYSALSLAEALPQEGKVTTCDHSVENLAIAKEFFAKSEHGKKITVFSGKAADCIEAITEVLDFVFIDADKMQISHYIDRLCPKLRTGGMIVIDNVLWKGGVLHPEEKRALALHNLNESLRHDQRFSTLVLPVRDGMTLLMKQ